MDEEVRGLVLCSPGDSIARYLAEGDSGFYLFEQRGFRLLQRVWVAGISISGLFFFPYLPGDFHSISFCYYNYLR